MSFSVLFSGFDCFLMKIIQFQARNLKNTVFSNWLEKGIIKVEDEKTIIKQFYYLKKILKKEKYIHYEISNFCKKGFASKHNLGYWKRKK